MPTIRLESASDTLDLASIERNGYGVQALSGASGLGLAPVAGQWLEGAGDGARYRGQRVLARDIDLPIDILGRTEEEFDQYVNRLSLMLSGDITLFWIDDAGQEWFTVVNYVAGMDPVWGADTTGVTDLRTVLTLRAGDPFFTSSASTLVTIGTAAASGLLTGSLATFRLSPSQTIGDVQLQNTYSANAYPLWTVKGPGNNFKAVAANGDTLWWEGTLASSDTLTIDTKTGRVVDQTGANRYDKLAPMPRFWQIPPGIMQAQVSLLGTTPGVSLVTCEWRQRARLVI